MNTLISPTTGKITSLLFFYEDSFYIEKSTKFDMSLNKKTVTLTQIYSHHARSISQSITTSPNSELSFS